MPVDLIPETSTQHSSWGIAETCAERLRLTTFKLHNKLRLSLIILSLSNMSIYATLIPTLARRLCSVKVHPAHPLASEIPRIQLVTARILWIPVDQKPTSYQPCAQASTKLYPKQGEC